MFAAALGKSIVPHLAPGEQLHGAVMAQAAGSNHQLLARALGGAAAGARRRPDAPRARRGARGGREPACARPPHGPAITSRRLLVFKLGGAFMPKAKELLGERAIRDVDPISVSRHLVQGRHAARGRHRDRRRDRPRPAGRVLPQALQRALAVG